jgi:hypothetical protein
VIKKPFILGAASLLAFALVAIGSNSDVRATHVPGNASSMAVDADPTGNTATSLGPREDCVETSAGGSATVDLTISDVPAGNPIYAFSLNMFYDPAVLTISSADTSSKMLAVNPGSSVTYFGDEVATPDTDGIFAGGAVDLSQDSGSQESGSGSLETLTIDVGAGAAAGGYQLDLIDASFVGGANPLGNDGGAHLSAVIAVDVTCGSLPTPEPPPAKNGDVDCTGIVNSVDALKVLRNGAQLSVTQTEPCIDIGLSFPHIGDVDCNGSVTSVDALKILRFNAGLSVTQTPPCDLPGT